MPLLSAAIRAYINLRAITLVPQIFHPGVVTEVLRVLTGPHRPMLHKLTVNTSCTDPSILVEIQGLRELGLQDPTRAVLQLLPGWLARLSTMLVEFHLRVRRSIP